MTPPFNPTGPSPPYGTAPLPAELQIYGPRSPGGDKCELVMATVDGGGEFSGGIAVAFVEVPSAKVRARVSIFCAPDANTFNPMIDDSSNVIADPWNLWAVLLTQAKFGGGAGVQFPTRDIVGTKAAPLDIPTNVGLWGFEFEVETAAQSRIMLRLTEINTGGSGSYQIRVQVTYQAVVPMSPQEWNRFTDRAGIIGTASHAG